MGLISVLTFVNGCGGSSIYDIAQSALADEKTTPQSSSVKESSGDSSQNASSSEDNSKEAEAKAKANIKYSLTVKTEPADARVRILNINPKYRDGIQLKSGSYHIMVDKSGYKSYKKWHKISGQDKNISVKLQKVPMYKLEVVSNPADAKVTVRRVIHQYKDIKLENFQNGQSLKVGTYKIYFSKDGYSGKSEKIYLNKDTKVEVTLEMTNSEKRKRVKEANKLLHSSAEKIDLEGVQKALKDGADVHSKDKNGLTLLHKTNSLDIAKLLIESGADVNVKTSDKATPLHSMAILGYLDIVKLLIEKGADIEAINSEGFTPLALAKLFKLKKSEQLLISLGADLKKAEAILAKKEEEERRRVKKLEDNYNTYISLNPYSTESVRLTFEVTSDGLAKDIIDEVASAVQVRDPNGWFNPYWIVRKVSGAKGKKGVVIGSWYTRGHADYKHWEYHFQKKLNSTVPYAISYEWEYLNISSSSSFSFVYVSFGNCKILSLQRKNKFGYYETTPSASNDGDNFTIFKDVDGKLSGDFKAIVKNTTGNGSVCDVEFSISGEKKIATIFVESDCSVYIEEFN